MPGDRLRRRPWSIPRLDGIVPYRGQVSRHQLPVHGRLRWQRLLLSGNRDSAGDSESSLPWAHHHSAREPRIQTDHTSVWILRRMFEKVWERQRLEILYGFVRLLAADCVGRRSNLLFTRWSQPQHRHIGPHTCSGSTPRSAPRGPHVRLALVRPRRQGWLGYISSRCWLHFWPGYFRNLQPLERFDLGFTRSPVGHGRIQLVSWQVKEKSHCCYCFIKKTWSIFGV